MQIKFYRIVTVYGWINKMLQSFSFRGRPVLLGGEAELAHYEIIAVLSNSFYGEYQARLLTAGAHKSYL